MANADVFNSGFDAGMKKNGKDENGEPLKIGKDIKSYKKGGKVKSTGLARLHKGEVVVPVKKANKKSLKKVACKG